MDNIKDDSDVISVIIPVFNTESFLNRCVKSVLSQDYNNLEVILVNDGSTDSSAEICNNFASVDKRVKVLHKTNGGASSARNAGIVAATGKYITFVDSDDTINPMLFNTLLKAIKESKSDISFCNITTVVTSTHRLPEQMRNENTIIPKNNALTMLLYQKEMSVSVYGKLYNRQLFASEQFRNDITYGEDLEINYKLFSKARRIAMNSSSGYYYLLHDASIMHAPFGLNRMSGLDVVESIYADIAKHNPALIRAAEYKSFYEALTIIWQIPYFTNKYNAEKIRCKKLIKSNAISVYTNIEAKLLTRMYALVSIFSLPILIIALKLKSTIKGLTR